MTNPMDRAAFQTFSEVLNEPLLLVSSGGEVLCANRAAEQLSGAPRGGLDGRPLRELVADEPERLGRRLGQFARARQALPASLSWQSPQGVLDVRCEGALVAARRGNEPALVMLRLKPRSEAVAHFSTLNQRIDQLSREVLERRRAEEELRAAQSRLHMASIAAQMGTWDIDIRTGEMRWSAELERILGASTGSAPATVDGFLQRVHALDREPVQAILQNDKGSQEHELEFRIERPDGEVRWMLWRGRAWCDPDGQPTRVAGIGIDITDRKRQERALRESEEWLRFTQQCAYAGSWEWDLITGRIFWSAEFYRLCGLEPGSLEPSYESWTRLIHPDDAARVGEETGRAIETGRELSVEFRIMHPLKGEQWLVSLGRTVYREDGQPLRLAGITIDITQRKRAEIAAQFLAAAGAEISSSLDYEATLRNLAGMAVPHLADWCAVDILDQEGLPRRLAVMHIDPARVELARDVHRRWPPSLDAPHGIAAVLRSGTPEIVPEISEEMLRAATVDEEHLRIVMALGLKSYMCVPLVAHGRILGALTFVSAESGRTYTEEDLRIAMELASRAATGIENARLFEAAQIEIQERRRAEEELARQSEITRTITENAASCLFMMDERGHPTYMNPAAEQVTGFTLKELRGRPLHDSIHYAHADGSPYPMEECPLLRALHGQEIMRNHEEVFFRKDGAPLPVSCSISPIQREGQILGAVLEFRDISEQKGAEEALRRHAEDLARINSELEDFAYITSHDLKEPLRGISNYASFLLEDYSDVVDESGRDKLRTLVRLSKRMYALLDALMEHARLGRIRLRLAECDMGEVAAAAREALRARLDADDVQLEIGSLPRLLCDRTLATQLLINLISNAVRYNTSVPKRVEIGALEGGVAGRTPVLYVRDNGIGIARQHLTTVFRMFKRLHHRDQYEGGIGFGLTIAQRIVQRHGGRIWAESTPGEGTTFYFTLQPGRGDERPWRHAISLEFKLAAPGESREGGRHQGRAVQAS
jgi:PAS domain S-box-containing protein